MQTAKNMKILSGTLLVFLRWKDSIQVLGVYCLLFSYVAAPVTCHCHVFICRLSHLDVGARGQSWAFGVPARWLMAAEWWQVVSGGQPLLAPGSGGVPLQELSVQLALRCQHQHAILSSAVNDFPQNNSSFKIKLVNATGK